VNSRQKNHLFNNKLSDLELDQHWKHLSRDQFDNEIRIWNAILCTNLKITSIPFPMIQIQIINTMTNVEYKDLRVDKIWIKRHKWGFRIEAWCKPGVIIFGTNRRFEWSEPDCSECHQHIFFSDGDRKNRILMYSEPEVSHHPECKLGWIEKIMQS